MGGYEVHRLPWLSVMLIAVSMVSADLTALAQSSNAKGKISRNFYRFPYVNSAQVEVNRDYVDHGQTPAGNPGPMDMRLDFWATWLASDGPTGNYFTLVAAADGVVSQVVDTRFGCGCDASFVGCNNTILIAHANGETSRYTHMQTGSARVTVGQGVRQGDPIAVEGDVGFTCGDGRGPSLGGCTGAPNPFVAGRCGRHLHWEVQRASTGEFVNPMVCQVPGHTLIDDTIHPSSGCDPALFCFGARDVSGETYSGFGAFHVLQSRQSITARNVTVKNNAGLVYHAKESVRLLPGFKAGAGSSYFRAELGECNQTAPTR